MLEEIGFYTLSDYRASQASSASPMWRCELIVTDRCNFRCPYCRGLPASVRGDLPLVQAERTLGHWMRDGLKNVRFSGGEPTMYPWLWQLVTMARTSVERIAISTNGSARREDYEALLTAGVDDVSVSLDSCCAAFADRMAGCNCGFDGVCENIRFLASRVYTTVGVVLTDENVSELPRTVALADSLGVADVRIIPAAQAGKKLRDVSLPFNIASKYPILRYRLDNLDRGVRGLRCDDPHRCRLVLDDSAVAGKHHYPCIIYLREHGEPIGEVGPTMRAERAKWSHNHDVYADPICRENCLDVCVAYNRKAAGYEVSR